MTIPSLTFARISTPGGPYAEGDVVSLAFDEPTIARLLLHGSDDRPAAARDAIVPESVSAVILVTSPPYAAGDAVTLSFLDPAIARVHAAPPRNGRDGNPQREPVHVTHSPLVRESVSSETVVARDEAASGRSGRFGAVKPAVSGVTSRDRARSSRAEDHIGKISVAQNASGAAASNDAVAVAASRAAAGVAASIGAIAADASNVVAAVPGIDRLKSSPAMEMTSRCQTAVEPSSPVATAAGGPAAAPGLSAETIEAARTAVPDIPNVVRFAERGPKLRGRHIRLEWPPERAERFVRVADKLFTVDRLGWYRHVLASRLLIADGIVYAGSLPEHVAAAARANAALKLVRTAGLEALGAPLLASYLPNFAVTSDWLATLQNESLVAALASLSGALDELAVDGADEAVPEPDALTGPVPAGRLFEEAGGHARADAALPQLVPPVAYDPTVTLTLSRYRETLLELFAQVAPASGAVRVRQLAQPNTVLDDRLWQVVSAVQQTLTTSTPVAKA